MTNGIIYFQERKLYNTVFIETYKILPTKAVTSNSSLCLVNFPFPTEYFSSCLPRTSIKELIAVAKKSHSVPFRLDQDLKRHLSLTLTTQVVKKKKAKKTCPVAFFNMFAFSNGNRNALQQWMVSTVSVPPPSGPGRAPRRQCKFLLVELQTRRCSLETVALAAAASFCSLFHPKLLGQYD